MAAKSSRPWVRAAHPRPNLRLCNRSRRSSFESTHPAAATFASIWPGLVAPAITELVTSNDSSQLNARSSSVWPRPSAKARSFSTASQFCALR